MKPPETRRLYQQVADQIRGLIRAGHFVPSSRLPAERDLAQQLGVSRPSLREALIALEIDGSVEIRMGSGVYVCALPAVAEAETRPLGESPTELMQARAGLEAVVVGLAAARITEEALAVLKETIDGMRAAVKAGRRPLDQDRLFHLTIASQTGNSVLARLVAELFDERHAPISARMQSRSETPENWVTAIGEHEAILDGLAAADPFLAQAAMRLHLEASQRRWIET